MFGKEVCMTVSYRCLNVTNVILSSGKWDIETYEYQWRANGEVRHVSLQHSRHLYTSAPLRRCALPLLTPLLAMFTPNMRGRSLPGRTWNIQRGCGNSRGASEVFVGVRGKRLSCKWTTWVDKRKRKVYVHWHSLNTFSAECTNIIGTGFWQSWLLFLLLPLSC